MKRSSVREKKNRQRERQEASQQQASARARTVTIVRNVAHQVRVLERLTAGRNPYVPAGNTCNILPPCISPTFSLPSLATLLCLFAAFMRVESKTIAIATRRHNKERDTLDRRSFFSNSNAREFFAAKKKKKRKEKKRKEEQGQFCGRIDRIIDLLPFMHNNRKSVDQIRL